MSSWNEGMAPIGHTPAMPAKMNPRKPTYEELEAAIRQIDETLRRNPDAGEPPRYKNARAAKITKSIVDRLSTPTS